MGLQVAFEGGEVDVVIELAVCRLLLGDAVAAYQITEAGSPEVQALIQATTRPCTFWDVPDCQLPPI